MLAIPALVLRPGRGPDDLEELTNVWRDSVEATHHYLSLEAIERLEPVVRDEYLPRLRIHVAERNGCTLGFIGMDSQHVAMLYVADEARSTGVGGALLDWAKEQSPLLSVDVNEQNPRAAVFYAKRGFTPVSRLQREAYGKPQPLLRMLWESPSPALARSGPGASGGS